jgi:hypothetical protein
MATSQRRLRPKTAVTARACNSDRLEKESILLVCMSIVCIASDAGCPGEDAARILASQLGFTFAGERRVASLLCEEYGSEVEGPAWGPAVEAVLARLALTHHLVLCFPGCEHLFARGPGALRVHVTGSEDRRAGNIMISKRLERPAAKTFLRETDVALREQRRKRFGKHSAEPFDLVLNIAAFEPEQVAAVISKAFASRGPAEFLTPQIEAEIRFHSRLKLASHGIAPNGKATLQGPAFGHPSEQTFAHLLDFYRVAWEYEPRSFPLQWDKDGNVLEAFTPDFYLPEFDLYLELTTMKQALVTRKNRKIKLLKTIYPHVNIQVFYQKDFQDLLGKYGITGGA